MSDIRADHAVLKAGRPSAAGEALRRRLDRNHLLVAVAAALLIHLLIVLSFWLIDLLRVRDIGEWTGPVVVKIGAPEAPDLPVPDDPTAEIEAPLPPETPVPPAPESPEAGETAAPVPEAPAPESAVPEPVSTPTATPTTPVQPAAPAAPQNYRVSGEEFGNSFLVSIDGTEEEVGRAAAYGYITSYMPLPEFLDQTLVDGARKYGMMSPEDIRGIILRYWEPGFDGYTKKPGAAGNIPLEIRPEYWSLLANSLGYDMANPEWKSANMRPVVVEFTVEPSQGKRGARLSDFDIVSSTNDPKINEAVVYGLSRWVYYNATDRPIKGRITYRFDR